MFSSFNIAWHNLGTFCAGVAKYLEDTELDNILKGPKLVRKRAKFGVELPDTT